ncbi:leucine-rich repeat receptor-like protein kinase [Corchorus olitorius]|uniref:Leucine-rich repeat receptor-like protein kinase n=1 Tax=Corchorus olitorius TaxID=93759 RepID=A0A1R3IWA8_9ROSI|nr:leucine-rich repeat receptor-like protein kinase [Corchorus olitorius]
MSSFSGGALLPSKVPLEMQAISLEIPVTVIRLTHLLMLRIEGNRCSRLVFALFGSPMEICKSIESDSSKPRSDEVLASPLMLGRTPTIVASFPELISRH